MEPYQCSFGTWHRSRSVGIKQAWAPRSARHRGADGSEYGFRAGDHAGDGGARNHGLKSQCDGHPHPCRSTHRCLKDGRQPDVPDCKRRERRPAVHKTHTLFWSFDRRHVDGQNSLEIWAVLRCSAIFAIARPACTHSLRGSQWVR